VKRFTVVFLDQDGDVAEVAVVDAPGAVSAIRKAWKAFAKDAKGGDDSIDDAMVEEMYTTQICGAPRRIK
jgi:hypothetical protein